MNIYADGLASVLLSLGAISAVLFGADVHLIKKHLEYAQ